MPKLIGTSGWSYKEWTGALYPKGTRASDYLSVYAQHFNTVEINNSFYRFPRGEMFKPWVEKTPKDFLFSVKMWRGIVHAKETNQRQVRDFFTAVDELGGKLGPILFQFPPHRPVNTQWLEQLLKAMPKGYDYIYELRDQCWLCDPVYDLLRKYNAANCFYDFKAFRNPEIMTNKTLYIRLHGPRKQPYIGRYSEKDMAHYANLMKHHRGKSFCYFDNTFHGEAVEDAFDLLELVHPAAKKHAA